MSSAERSRDSEGARPLRLFVAVELPDSVKRSLDDAGALLRQAGATEGLRWVRPAGVHLTLKFLGATAPDRVPEIAAALGDAFAGAGPFDLQPEGFGAFHGGRKAATFRTWRESYPHNVRVVWVGLSGDTAALNDLASRSERALNPLGFPRERNPFFAHLTLARVREDAAREQREQIAAALDRLPNYAGGYEQSRRPAEFTIALPPFRVDAVSFMQSTLQPGGAVYEALHTFPLDSERVEAKPAVAPPKDD